MHIFKGKCTILNVEAVLLLHRSVDRVRILRRSIDYVLRRGVAKTSQAGYVAMYHIHLMTTGHDHISTRLISLF